MADTNREFERYISNLGEATNPAGDGVYQSPRMNRRFDDFRAGFEAAGALASRPAEVDDASAKAGGQVGMAQAETRMDAGFQPVVGPAPEVDDEGLPPLPPSAWVTMDIGSGSMHYFTAEQFRQGQRDALAADRARMPDADEISDAITEAYNYSHSIKDWDAAKYWSELGEKFSEWAAPSHTTNKEK